MKLFLATRNAGKIREMRAILEQQKWAGEIELHTGQEFPELQEPEETGGTFAENARLKASAYARATGMVALADDSGLAVDALHGQPGVQSARYGKDDTDRIQRLLGALEEIKDAEARSAYFACALAVAAPDGHILAESQGRLDGYIAEEPRGGHGFGYDPVFHVPELGCRLAEAEPEVKNRISHRSRAMEEILPKLEAIVHGRK